MIGSGAGISRFPGATRTLGGRESREIAEPGEDSSRSVGIDRKPQNRVRFYQRGPGGGRRPIPYAILPVGGYQWRRQPLATSGSSHPAWARVLATSQL